jgi:DNA polymerase-3 subunit epsilon/ATP-dependent DNA helicase DinG
MEPQTYVSLDLETTGLDPQRDEIIEVAAVMFRGEGVLGNWHSLVNPRRPIPSYITALTGITQAMVEEAPPFSSVVGELVAFLRDYPIVGHRPSFDLGFLSAKGLALANPAYDTWELAHLLLPTLGSYQLGRVAAYLGIEHKGGHRAQADALAAKRVFLALLERVRGWDRGLLQEIAALCPYLKSPLASLLQELVAERMSAALLPTLQPAPAALGQPLEPLVRRAEPAPVAEEELEALLAEGGPFSRALPHYEERPQQQAMACAVAQALNRGERAVIEAGTGVGKSLAYLLPSALYALRNGTPVVISTNTINLQEQLLDKDIPDLRRALAQAEGLPASGLEVALLKGRSHYLCWRRWAFLRQAPEPSPAEARFLLRLAVWLSTTTTGDRGELNLTPEEEPLWGKVCVQMGDCAPAKCPHHQRGRCFLYLARERARGAHLVLVNHALLLSDLSSEGRVLPDYRHLVIDEAHHLEEEATNQLGFRAGQDTLNEFLERLIGPAGRSWGGVVGQLQAYLRTLPAALQGEAATLLERISRDGAQARRLGEGFFQLLAALVGQTAEEKGEYGRHLRLTPALHHHPLWSQVTRAWSDCSRALSGVEERLGRLYPLFNENDELAQELAALSQAAAELRGQLGSLTSAPQGQWVYWITQNMKGVVSLHRAPLHVGPILEETLFSAKETVVLTSATMSTEGTFEYLKGRLGISPQREVILGSPFDYKGSTLLWLARGLPEPGSPSYQRALEGALLEVLKATRGRALVLFTSHEALRATLEGIRPSLEEEGILVLGHGVDGSRSQLLETFRDNQRAVLLGTSSFWEGVDVVGEALSLLVIARLPFNVPTDPVFAARYETFADGFNQFALPLGILRFRQGFGRLIRSRHDRGVVAVLDSRILSKSYGRAFLQSLPPCTVRTGPVRELAQEAARWLLSFQTNLFN